MLQDEQHEAEMGNFSGVNYPDSRGDSAPSTC